MPHFLLPSIPPPPSLHLSSPKPNSPPIPPISTSLLASNVAGKPIWQSHLCQKDGGGLQRAHFWLQRRFRVRVCLSQPALIIFRCIWWPLPLFSCQHPRVCIRVCMLSKWLIMCKWDGRLSGIKLTRVVLCLSCHLGGVMSLGVSGRTKVFVAFITLCHRYIYLALLQSRVNSMSYKDLKIFK